jgi:hypothetical protein
MNGQRPSFQGNQIPGANKIPLDLSFITTGPGVTVGSGFSNQYLYYTPKDTGQRNPLTCWQGVYDEVTNRIRGPYISSLDTTLLSQDFLPGYSLPNWSPIPPTAPATDATPAPPPVPTPKARGLSRADILICRDVLRIINPHIVFQPISRVMSSTVIRDLLQLRWIQRNDHFLGPGIDYQITNTSQATAFNEGTSQCPPTAIYEFDMQTGMGSNVYYWWSPTIPTPAQLLQQWAKEDAFTPGGTPVVRGKLSPVNFDGGFIQLGNGSNSIKVQGDWVDTFTFTTGLGAISGGTPGGGLVAPSGGSQQGGNGGGDGRD